MNKIIKFILLILAFSLIYIILREKINLYIFIAGCLISFFSIIIADRFLLDERYVNLFKVNIFRFIAYFLFLLYKIIASGIKAALLTLSGNAKHEFFSYKSKLDDDFKLNLLANSITLTPGTVTVNREESNLLILQLCKIDDKYSIIEIEKFEKKLLKL